MSSSRRQSRHKSWSLLVGLGAAGCMQVPGKPVTQQDGPAFPSSAAPALGHVDPDAEPPQIVWESVNDSVDRTTRILEQLAQARQTAEDLREMREARAQAADSSKDRPSPEDEASLVERLAAAVRKGQAIDPVPTANVGSNPNAPRPASAEVASVDPRFDPATVSEEADLGDARPAGMTITPFPNIVSGSVDGSTRTQIERHPQAPTVTRQSAADPFLAMQEKYANRVASDPRDLSAQMELQLLRFLRGETVPAVADLSPLEAEDRELLAAMCDALSNFRSVVKAEPNPLGSDKARPFVEMADRIRARTDLTISSLTLCDVVYSYGNYQPITPLRFTAGTPRKSVLYCEVDGFLSQLNDKQLWETRLSLELRLYDDRGVQVWSQKPEPVVDTSRKRRRDFFVGKIIQLPSNLRPGHYLLKACVRDTQANRVNESTLQFDVMAKGG